MLKVTVLSYMHIPTSIESDCSPAPAYKIRVSEMVMLHASQFAFFQACKKKRRNVRKEPDKDRRKFLRMRDFSN